MDLGIDGVEIWKKEFNQYINPASDIEAYNQLQIKIDVGKFDWQSYINYTKWKYTQNKIKI